MGNTLLEKIMDKVASINPDVVAYGHSEEYLDNLTTIIRATFEVSVISILFGIAAMLCAFLIAFTTTPVVRVLAYKLKAIDIPIDNRRMHKQPVPRLGGLAIFLGFVLTTLIFSDITPTLITIWIGGSAIVLLGMLDDIFRLRALVKLFVQIGVAFVAVWQGLIIENINLFGHTIDFKHLAIPITILWIVGLTNAINLIDGLDGLSCGVSAISAISLLMVSIVLGGDSSTTVLIAILAGSCLGFLPFNTNPAKIFMGDTGALFLGYTLSVVSIKGVLKTHTLVSFIIPLLIFAFPILDTAFAFTRRILHGKSPFSPDRGHLHHRLIDMGLNQKQVVAILYSLCAILGLSAIMFTGEKIWRAAVIVLIGLVLLIINFALLKNPKTREKTGIDQMTSKEGDTPKAAPVEAVPKKKKSNKKKSKKK
ncbi:MAG: undecaprenyl/decaprenyl-phosphate alpha-N-acetylglucosaminyl 1-phosphate transferase [Clostridia bacterium]|nr:undecaprenyl/decaprenyl-phosphate alpha-N-acetylglucosaminyl 1-phosphate transferase [Clostridia bacterium]